MYVFIDRWWGAGDCPDFSQPSSDETSELQLDNVAGIFFVLLGGIALATISLILDTICKRFKV